jgi:hypothetical protein
MENGESGERKRHREKKMVKEKEFEERRYKAQKRFQPHGFGSVWIDSAEAD